MPAADLHDITISNSRSAIKEKVWGSSQPDELLSKESKDGVAPTILNGVGNKPTKESREANEVSS